jgi:hypothetical protein
VPRPAQLLLTALVGVFLAAPAADARSFTIKARGSETSLGVVRVIGDFRPARDPTLAAAIRAYGRPTRKTGEGEVCRVRWAALGVRMLFSNFGAVACRPQNGLAQKAVLRGQRPWHTAKGLAIGDGVGKLRRIYPRAPRTTRGFRLVQGILPFGAPRPYSVLGARASGGRVTAFTLFIGAAGD